ncbi:MAG: TonB-dependent receptor [Prolixibacteraceae bacterium]|nr:TonB-dependent receptor [Prolixibacteraceae bacterium]
MILFLSIFCIISVAGGIPKGNDPAGSIYQQRAVSGKIADAKGLPLPGVTVLVKGTTQGTITDSDGEYSLSGLPDGATLVFSFVGMHTQEIVVGTQTVINVTMEEETIGLEEVIAIGYGTQKKENLTGAVSYVDAETLDSRPVPSIGQGLQGTVSNLNVTQTTGTPGRGASFNIRGYESITGGSPLILVDGIPMDINVLNPQDIESVTVLKDAASSAIYGARAAFGVILVTTKSGKESLKPQVSLSMNYSVNEPTAVFQPMDSKERMEYMNTANNAQAGQNYYQFPEWLIPHLLAYYEDPVNNPSAVPDINDPNTWMPCGNVDWTDELYRDSYPQQQYTASISGGSEKVNYYSSISYFSQVGMPRHFDEKYERYNLLSNISYDVTDWITIGAKISVNNMKKFYPPDNKSGGFSETNLPQHFVQWANWPVYTPDGNYWAGGAVANMVFYHEEGGYRKRDGSDSWLTGLAILKPFKNTVFNIDYSYNREDQNEISTYNVMPQYKVDGSIGGSYPHTDPNRTIKSSYGNRYWAFNAYGTYDNDFGKHSVKWMLGFNQENSERSFFEAERENKMIESMPFLSLSYGLRYVDDSATEFAIRGAFTRFNYIYDNRYFIEFNGRYDGTSKFPKDDRFAFFPSASVGWRLENEPYLSGLQNTFDMLKLRASYGSLGNQSVPGNYPYIASFSSGQLSQHLIGNSLPMTVYAPGLVSPTLTWETVTQQNLGIDVAILQNRLSATFDIYRRDTKNMLTKSKTLPAVLAVNEPQENAADLKTTGWELSVDWRHRIRELGLGARVVLSDYTATITEFDNPKGIFSDYYVGKDIGEIWGLVTGGIFQTDEEAKALDQTRISGRERLAGDLYFEDLDGDGKITYGNSTLENPGDRKIIGNSTPRYSFGVTTDADWKGFDLKVFFQGIGKQDRWLSTGTFLNPWTSEWTTMHKVCTDWWSPENTDAFFPRPLIQGGSDVAAVQTRYLQNAAYLRLKQLTFGYTIPATLTQRFNISKIRVYFSGNNLWEINNIYKKIVDPEMTYAGAYSIYRSSSFGANISF